MYLGTKTWLLLVLIITASQGFPQLEQTSEYTASNETILRRAKRNPVVALAGLGALFIMIHTIITGTRKSENPETCLWAIPELGTTRAVYNIPNQAGLVNIMRESVGSGETFERCIDAASKVSATITPKALGQSESIFGSSFDGRMKQMGNLTGDVKGHIIATSLGGPAAYWNLFPQACRFKSGTRAEKTGGVESRSMWERVESEVKGFLADKSKPCRNVRYTVVFNYLNMSNLCRPSNLSLELKYYQNDVLLPQMTFNHNFINGKDGERDYGLSLQ